VAHPDVLDALTLEHFEAGFTMLDRMVGSAYEGQNQPLTVIHRGVYPGTDGGDSDSLAHAKLRTRGASCARC